MSTMAKVRGKWDGGDLVLTDLAGTEIARIDESAADVVLNSLTVSNPITMATQLTVEAHTGDDTLTTAETGSMHTNLGAAGAVTLTLPQDAAAGDHFYFTVQVAQELRLDPGAAGAIYLIAGKGTDDKYATANAIGESIMLTADGNGDWIGSFETGTWTFEA